MSSLEGLVDCRNEAVNQVTDSSIIGGKSETFTDVDSCRVTISKLKIEAKILYYKLEVNCLDVPNFCKSWGSLGSILGRSLNVKHI